MKKRKFLVGALMASCAVCSSVALSFSLSNAKAAADSDLVSVETFQMMEGAQVRKESGTVGSQTALDQATGIRFRMYINQEYFASVNEVGIYVALASEATADDMKDETTADEKSKWLFTASAENELVALEENKETEQAVYVLNAVVANPPEADYNTQLIANGYVEVDGEKTFTSAPQTRSTAQVASLALIDGDGTTEKDPHGTLNHYVDTVVANEGFAFANTEIATDKYKTANPTVGATLPANLTAKWESSDEEVATVDANGNITRVGEGETTITATLGSTAKTATLTLNAPQILKVSETTVSSVLRGSTGANNVYVAGDSLNFTTNGYEGDAIAISATNGVNCNIVSPYNASVLNEIEADGYTNVNMWLAVSEGMANTGGGSSFFNKSTGTTWASVSPAKTWKKYTLTISDFASLIDTSSLYVKLIGFDGASSTIYFGDISFEKPTILTVTEDSAAKIIRGTVTGTYVAAGADVIKDFAGDYTGNASVMTSAPGTNCFVKTSYTSTTINEIVEKYGYTHVSMWMAVSAQLNVGGASVYTKAVGETWGAVKTTNTWVKYTVSIADFVGQLTDSDGQVKLINFQMGNVQVYFGDIIFETIAE